MKTEKFQLRGDNSVCTGAFQLLLARATAQLRGKIGNILLASRNTCTLLKKVFLTYLIYLGLNT
jgi:hypothetical protein